MLMHMTRNILFLCEMFSISVVASHTLAYCMVVIDYNEYSCYCESCSTQHAWEENRKSHDIS